MNARRHVGTFAATLVLAATALTPPLALACSGPLCVRGGVLPASGSIPTNMAMLLWQKPQEMANQVPNEAARLSQRTAAGDIPVAWSPVQLASGLVKVVPDVPIAPAAKLVFSYDAPCGGNSERVETELTVSELALRPSSLGALVVEMRRGTIEEAGGAPCKTNYDAVYADLRVELPSEALPYADVILYERIIDGRAFGNFQVPDPTSIWGSTPPAFGGSRLGRGVDRISASCDPKAYAPSGWPGKHRVKMRGTLPDGTVLHSEEVEVDLRCESAPEPEPLPSEPPPAEEPAPSERETGDPLATMDEESLRDERHEGCAISEKRDSGSFVLTMAALAGFMLRRQRHRGPRT